MAIRDIIAAASRQAGVLAPDEDAEYADLAEGLARLATVLAGLPSAGVGENLKEVRWDRLCDGAIPANSRLAIGGPRTALRLDLPHQPHDGARVQILDVDGGFVVHPVTLGGHGRRIEGSASDQVLDEPGFNGTWLYRADLGDWLRIDQPGLDDPSPYPPEFDDVLVLMLAMRLLPPAGPNLSPESQAVLQRDIGQMRARYRQRTVTPTDPGLRFQSRQTWDWGFEGR